MKYKIMKYAGDDPYSWAVFRAEEVKGMISPICEGQAKPVTSGMNRSEANRLKISLEGKV